MFSARCMWMVDHENSSFGSWSSFVLVDLVGFLACVMASIRSTTIFYIISFHREMFLQSRFRISHLYPHVEAVVPTTEVLVRIRFLMVHNLGLWSMYYDWRYISTEVQIYSYFLVVTLSPIIMLYYPLLHIVGVGMLVVHAFSMYYTHYNTWSLHSMLPKRGSYKCEGWSHYVKV